MATPIRTEAGLAGTGLSIALPLLGVNPLLAGAVAGGAALIGLVDKIGQGRRTANTMTENGGPQDIINKQLAAIASSGSSAADKAAATDTAWKQFLQATTEFAAQGPTHAKVAMQAIQQTPGLTNTVQGLLGGKNPLDSSYVGPALQAIQSGKALPNEQPVGSTLLQAGIAAGTPFAVNALKGLGASGKLAGAATGGGSTVASTGLGGGNVDPASGLPVDAFGNPSGSVAGGGGSDPGTGMLGGVDENGAQIFTPSETSALNSLETPSIAGAASNAAHQGRGLLSSILGNNPTGSLASIIPGVVGSIVQGNAIGNAANQQAQSSQATIDFLKQLNAQQQANQQPWLTAGSNALTNLNTLMAPGGSLYNTFNTAPPKAEAFTLPTEAEVEATPGFQFTLNNGLQALQHSAAAKLDLNGGQTAKSLEGFAEGLASTNYQNAVNNKLTANQTNFGNQNTTFHNQQEQGQNIFNQNASIAGLGQTAAGNANASSGQTGSSIASTIQGAGNNAAGATIAGGNVLSNALAGTGNAIQQQLTLQQLMAQLAKSKTPNNQSGVTT